MPDSRAPNQRFRKKRSFKKQTDRHPQSRGLREIRDQVQQGAAAQALTRIEELLTSGALAAETQGKILALAADSEYKRGAFEAAAEIHASAAQLTQNDPLLWLRPRMGQVRALLKAARIEEAWQAARQTYEEAQAQWADFQTGTRQAATFLKKGTRVLMSPRPQRLSVVAAELGRLFLREGEMDAAKEFLQAAITACPKGATRARESLAEISLREGDAQTALEWAMQALMMGRLQAKTLHTLRLLVQIKRQLGDPTVSPEILALVRTAQPSISARATLLLIQELRSAESNDQWKPLAQTWLAKNQSRFPVEAAEIKKIILRECKQNAADPQTSLAAAKAVLAQPGISPGEYLSAAKEVVRSGWWAGLTPDLDAIVATAAQLHGVGFAQDVAHSIALSTMMAKRHDIAIPWLEAQRRGMTPGTAIWGKVTWALAVAYTDQEQIPPAIGYYDEFAQNEALPLNLRAQARLRWVRHLIKTGDTGAMAAGLDEVKALLPSVDDWSTLLDIARQLCHVPGQEADAASNAFFEKAEQLAFSAVNDAQHPSEAISILLKLARRTTYDFSRPKNTIHLWETLGEAKRQWLWSENADFWEWVSLVLFSYLEANQMQRADTLHAHLSNDAGTPKLGKLILFITYGDWLMKRGETTAKSNGLALLSLALDLDNSHVWSRKAHYWWALEYWNAGDKTQAKVHAEKVRLFPWNGKGMLEDWEMAAKAEWIIAEGDATQLDPKFIGKFSQSFFDDHKPDRR